MKRKWCCSRNMLLKIKILGNIWHLYLLSSEQCYTYCVVRCTKFEITLQVVLKIRIMSAFNFIVADPGSSWLFHRNSCTFGHKLGKRLIGDYHRCASKVVLSPFVLVAFRFPSSCFILAHLFLHPFPMASSALSGTCLWFRRFFRCLLHVRSYVFSLVVISLWLTHLWFLTQAYGVPLQNLNAKFELEAKRFSIAFFATVPGWVLKCISFWHSNLPYFKTIYLLTTSVNAKYYL